MRAHGREAWVRGERDAAKVQCAVGLGWLGRDLRKKMTSRPHPSARHRERRRCGLRRAAGGLPKRWAARELARLSEDLGQKQRRKKGKKKTFLKFSKELTKIELKHKFEFNKYKQCNNMSATVNSYSSLI
jgi:hypothetical protein